MVGGNVVENILLEFLPYELVSKILYEFGGLRHPLMDILRSKNFNLIYLASVNSMFINNDIHSNRFDNINKCRGYYRCKNEGKYKCCDNCNVYLCDACIKFENNYKNLEDGCLSHKRTIFKINRVNYDIKCSRKWGLETEYVLNYDCPELFAKNIPVKITDYNMERCYICPHKDMCKTCGEYNCSTCNK